MIRKQREMQEESERKRREAKEAAQRSRAAAAKQATAAAIEHNDRLESQPPHSAVSRGRSPSPVRVRRNIPAEMRAKSPPIPAMRNKYVIICNAVEAGHKSTVEAGYKNILGQQ